MDFLANTILARAGQLAEGTPVSTGTFLDMRTRPAMRSCGFLGRSSYFASGEAFTLCPSSAGSGVALLRPIGSSNSCRGNLVKTLFRRALQPRTLSA